MAPSASELFADAKTSIEITDRFDAYKTNLNKALARPVPYGITAEQQQILKTVSPDLHKGIAPSTLNSLQRSLQSNFIGKDLDLAGPGSTGGLHQYDLEAPAKDLVPRKTPLRNRIARTRGVGTAHEFKRITGYTGAQTGGLPLIHPGMGETDTTAFGSLNLRRGKIIQYAGDHISVPFRKFSISDRVTWDGYQAGRGFQDLRTLSTTDTLFSAMLLEERMLLASRGTASGFTGAVATPSAPTVTTPAAGTGQTAVTGISAANIYATITASTMWGETAISAVGNSAFSSGDVVTISWTHVPGATSYNVFLGQGASQPADSAIYFQASTASNTITLQGAIATSGRAASAVNATNTPTAFDNGYDGILATLLDPNQSGYIKYVNGPLASETPFQDAFASMFDQNQADPETIILNGHDRRSLSDLLTSQSSASYRIMVPNGADGSNASVGALATAVQNGVTGTMVELLVHPFMPRGIAPIMSWTLPLPNSNISQCWSVVNVADYQAVEWPVIEFTYDFSVYWQGTFCAFAPSFSGIVAGISAS